MANLLQSLRSTGTPTEQRYSLDDYVAQLSNFGFGPVIQQTLADGGEEKIGNNFPAYVQNITKRNGVVFACQATRLMLFSEARFQFRQFHNGRPGDLEDRARLEVLRRPWPNGATGDLLGRMILDADLAGNAYVRRDAMQGKLEVLRPDWTTIVLGSQSLPEDAAAAHDAEFVGLMYQPGGIPGKHRPRFFDRSEVAHWAWFPDPEASFRGMSWMTPILREIAADSAATTHKLKFFSNGATPNMVVSFDPSVTAEQIKTFKALIEEGHVGAANAYKTLYLGGGADAEVVGSTFEQMSFKTTQGAGETRICAAARVPPVIVGVSEGLQAATYSNYGQARRHFADGTLRPLWRSAAAALESIVPAPSGYELWYDDRDIPFLQEDLKDAADIQSVQATTISQFITAGFTPESAVAAAVAGDSTLLQHSGLVSVQLQVPGSQPATSAPPADESDEE